MGRVTSENLEHLPLPDGWTTSAPDPSDLPRLGELRGVVAAPFTGSSAVNQDALAAEVAGPVSWTRRQVVARDPEGVVRGWAWAHDRAAGRATVWGYFDRDVPEVDAIAETFYRWAEDAAVAMARLRGVTATRLDESPFAGDTRQLGWLARAGYAERRTWLHMVRPVTPDEARLTARPGVTVRPVERHENGLPVATDLQTVHEMLETSFQDHFNSYRESFTEFVQRLREDPGHSWDHWWLAYVDDDGRPVPAGTVVCSSLAAPAGGAPGTYVEYIGVTRAARGRGVAKSLLATVIADAARSGRDRVALEVDADSPTRADELYRSLGWETEHVTESWFKDLDLDG